MSAVQDKFQQLLRELFQFDCADLDFGIYRIMNHKRDVVEKFITQDLPQWVDEGLTKGALTQQTHAAKELAEAREKVLEALGDDALDASGNLSENYHKTKAGQEYLAARERAKSARGHEALETSIYNHLWSFFNRYYQDGDFISKRRYSKKERYAIPYNGEEVTLYWANHDQYYIKTGEYFTDYTWKAPNNVTVHFKLKAADVEQGNVKGEKRFFLPQLDDIVWEAKEQVLIIHFEYRPLTAQEAISYGQKNQQEAILAAACEKIPTKLSPKTAADALAALCAEKQIQDDKETYLAYHLRQYTKRNTADFFIHKDLKGFLSRELDFYLKNEVLNLEEMEHAGETISQGWFQLMRVIKNIGMRIIEFLHQIEEFQKMLWEKRKFITEVGYCITVGNITKDFYPDIAICEAQWDEWKELFHIDEEATNLFTAGKSKKEKRIEFLKDHPTLVLDSKYFDIDFIDHLLASFDGLDEITDGLLVHSENWQALNLMADKYRAGVQCVHIDPPYNTQTSGFLYKNDFQHSSWLAMMENRVLIAESMISATGHILCHIDENEYERLKILLDNLKIPDAGTVIWDKRNPMTARRGVATQHEYIVWRSPMQDSIYLNNTNITEMLKTANEIITKHGGVNDAARREYSEWLRSNEKLSGGEKAYCYLDEQGKIYGSVSLRAPEPRTDPKFFVPLLHPTTKKPCAVPPNGFSRTPATLREMAARGEILFGADETIQPRQKRLLLEESKMQIRSIIQDAKKGKSYLDDLGLAFDYCHPVSLYKELIGACDLILGKITFDYFAGSGTSGHATISLNREDGGRRKFILVEMADYFDTVLMPRIKKVTFTPEWKDGKPKRRPTDEETKRSPRIVKYIRLESYEDALNNIAFDSEGGQQAMQFEDYLLSYMLKWESRNSDTMLNVEKLAKPFDYKLNIHRDGETRTQKVNLPETFGYLLGLHVQSRKVYENKGHKYLVYRGKTREGQNISVIWRETEGWTKEDFQRDRDFVAKQNLCNGADDIFVNGDSFIPNARALEPIFKAKMFAPVEG